MGVNSLVMKWAWVLFIAVTFANALTFRSRARGRIEGHPELKDGYAKLINGFMFWGNIPWAVMGLGCLVGGVPSVFSFFHLRDGNPFVVAFWASLIFVWAAGTYWVFLRGGAEMLVRHPGLVRPEVKSPRVVKLLWGVCLLGGVAAAVMAYFGAFPAPK